LGGALRRRGIEVGTRAAARVGVAGTFAAAQHLHLVGDDFGGVSILAVLPLPFARFDAAFYVDGAAFAQVFSGDFSQAVVEHDAMPFGFFAALAGVFVFPLRAGGDGDIADGGSIGAVTHFRVAPQVTDENRFVD